MKRSFQLRAIEFQHLEFRQFLSLRSFTGSTIMTEKKYKALGYKDILKIAGPVIISSFALTAMNVTDIAFLGRLSEIALGASAIAGIFYFVISIIGIAIGSGVQILIARKTGEKEWSSVGKIFDQGIYILLIISAFLFVIMKIFSAYLFSKFLSSAELAEACSEYLDYRAWGIFFSNIIVSYRALYIGTSRTRVLGTNTAVMLVINVFMNYCLVFGNFGFPALGIGGSALASSISECCAALFFIIYTRQNFSNKIFALYRFEMPDMGWMKKIWKISSPLVVQYTVSLGGWLIFFVMVERLGKHELAISNVVRGTYMIIMTPVWGLATATNSLVSNTIGQKNFREVIPLVRKIISISFVITSIMIIAAFCFPLMFLGINSSDQTLIRDSIPSFQVLLLATLIFSVSSILLNAITGGGNTRAALYIELIAIALYLAYIYISVIEMRLSIEIIWGAEVFYWILIGIFSYRVLRKGKWVSL
jgi:putative MATE family efflux protein